MTFVMFLGFALAITCVPAKAQRIHVDFVGLVSNVLYEQGAGASAFFPGLGLGSQIFGFFEYDDNPAVYDQTPQVNPNQTFYRDVFPDNGISNWSVSFGGTTHTYVNAVPGVNIIDVLTQVVDAGPSDPFRDAFGFSGLARAPSLQFTRSFEIILFAHASNFNLFTSQSIPSSLTLTDFDLTDPVFRPEARWNSQTVGIASVSSST